MDRARLAGMLLSRQAAEGQDCRQLSATKFIATADWDGLASHEREYLRCYSVSAAAYKSVLVGRSAARLNGLWVVPNGEELVELAQTNGNPPPKRQWPEGVLYRHIRVPEVDWEVRQPLDRAGAGATLRVTTPARTVADIARFHGIPEAVAAIDGRYSGTSPIDQQSWCDRILAVAERMRGKRGIGRARQAVALSSAKSESPFESVIRVLLALRRIKVDEQMWIGRKYRVDLLWGTLVIEIDGYLKFKNKPYEEVIKQETRDRWLKEQGYAVIRLFPAEIIRDPEGCIRRILEMKAEADANPSVRVRATVHRPR
ncbi:DUF559 domain-containing protein [Corynebacterium fournieri]|uniref:DUF559 domain-containing protein n=1 Tax=Corynebacterium fournieri TaxID=1852390 RepID=UPI000A2F16F8|nr:DUF559 domain-containing protein [Corynebacterium fournieri]WJY98341.1 hypothetical protein CFOUR_09785 [Corynebacterium fournieri]